MIRSVVTLLLVIVLFGCKSRPLGPYISPRVTGQVLAADTHKPLAGVSVIRGSGEGRKTSPPKGAELLIRKAPVQTDESGRFELASERVLSVVRGVDWDVVSLSFVRIGYQHFQTNCPIATSTNAPSGESVLDVGRIFLQPAVKSLPSRKLEALQNVRTEQFKENHDPHGWCVQWRWRTWRLAVHRRACVCAAAGNGDTQPKIWHSGDYPVVWTNQKYKMICLNMGHNYIDSRAGLCSKGP